MRGYSPQGGGNLEILSINNYSISYDGRRSAVDAVSLTVARGEILSIVGESGSGKSTLLHGVLGLLPAGAAARGSLALFGEDVNTMSGKARRALRGSRVSMIFQDTGRYMNPIARIGAQYDEFLRVHGMNDARRRRDLQREMLLKLHLSDPERVLRAYPFELSGGMRQRVGIAIAMSLKPELLLADEPTSALDVTVQAQVIRQMMELRESFGTAIVLVTHNIGVAAYLSDRIGVMQNGKLVELGDAAESIDHTQHPEPRSLLDAVVEIDDESLIVNHG
ncbi:MAG: ABC transporter ATP-binding protein [Clostridia bacterium]|nr:ABC transporter ATP-binding protein [Clostridia bacterium]